MPTDRHPFTWDLPHPHILQVRVGPQHIDVMRHTNNVVYLQWLEDVAWSHSMHLGLGPAEYEALGHGMVVRQHELNYIQATRLGERGYNQAWELVKAMHALWRRHTHALPLETLATALVRLGETPDQHSLGREARLRNLRGAFAAHPSHVHQLPGRHVLLVDDVTTTGATLHTAAQALLLAGADRVSALVFARTPPSR